MDVLSDAEISNIVQQSKLVAKYNQVIDSNSAYEMLTAKLQEAATAAQVQAQTSASTNQVQKGVKPEENTLEKIANNTIVKSMMRTAGTTIVRSLLGSLGLGGRTRRSSKSWF